VTLNWLGGTPPATAANVTWGVPWPRGAVRPDTPMRLTATDGRPLEVDSWPLAYWPDGSLKWTGHALAAPTGLAGPLTLAPATTGGASAGSETHPAIHYNDDAAAFTINTGALVARIARHGDTFFESLKIGARTVGAQGRLIALREDRADYEAHGIVREERFLSRLRSVTLEQSSPRRAVIKVEGAHHAAGGEREWLPFTVRLYFHAGSADVRLVHTFLYDGDPARDFIKGLGLSFTVPFAEELHNRHLRFAGDEGGIWVQPVRMLPGYRPQAGAQVSELYAAHLAGRRIPNLAELTARARDALITVPVWADAKLSQPGPNSWSLHKRTSADASWLHFTDGRRATGLAVLGDVSGGLAVGVKDFWQKHPASLELLNGAADAGEIRVWLWSPDAPAMDLRRYDERPHGLVVNYEDWKPGWGTPLGIANTHELTLRAFAAVPSNEELTAFARAVGAPPLLVATPEYYHARGVFGNWSLPDRSTPTLRWIEDQVHGLVDFYRAQVEERSWYGFWDYGDIMHNYDFGRHEWRYDVGGWAWVNTELMPDMLLWYSFLRSGRAELYRFAEAMTRHTSEVDVHHTGPFAPLGSRHNVNHWGDGAKQPRISHAGLKRAFYFLSGGDERVGDLLREQVDADLAYEYLVQFNASHYVPTADGGHRLDERARVPAPRPEEFGPRPLAADRKPFTRFGLEWMCYALNWTTEWERGLDPAWRSRIEADMRTMAASVDADGRFPGRYFDMIFGGPENMAELEPMYDIPDFWAAWAETCEAVGRQVSGGQMTGPRMLAYAARRKNDPELGRLAWEKLIGTALTPAPQPQPYSGPDVMKPVTDPAFLGAPVGWQLHGVASVQWALNAIETLELAKPWLPLWEKNTANAAVP
ncbi:MAG TPA: Tat pathway signal sequence domain protein, partial [Opitutaceae bacterium]